MRIFLFLVTALACTSCHFRPLSCRSEYLDTEYLAASRIDTPDPARLCFFGEQIVVHWGIPQRCYRPPVELHLHVHYGDLSSETHTTFCETPCGYWTYRLMGDEYLCRGGIIAYQAELYQDGCLTDTWTHSLWTDLIHVGEG